jgi:hypothetical protein
MLKSIELPDLRVNAPLTPEMEALLSEADRRIDDFLHHWRGPIIENFVASDYRTVNTVLTWIVKHQLSAGHMFCEWGSGFGVVTMMAALHDFTAFGIEVESELVDRARTLAGDLDIPVEFSQGSFIPSGGHRLIQYQEDVAHIETDTPSGYDEFDLEIADFDLFFAFPWPGENRFWDNLFHHYASEGALLLTYHGIEELRLQRKVRG